MHLFLQQVLAPLFPLHPYAIVVIGIGIVLGLIIGLRINAFIALITAALVVSFLAPGDVDIKVTRVADAFGASAGKIGLVIGFAGVIGEAMMRSGAADRIVQEFLRLLGVRRAPWALMSSGFILSIPVFFDTVFYLLVPLARSLYRSTRRNYLFYLCAIAAGGAITHTLVPPTPGPLFMAANLKIPVGTMIVVGLMVAAPSAVIALAVAAILDRRVQLAALPTFDDEGHSAEQVAAEAERRLADVMQIPFLEALLPVVLPVILISGDTIVGVLAAPDAPPIWQQMKPWTAVLGNPNFALLLSMALAVITWVRFRNPGGKEFSEATETSLLSGGLVILITAAGGAFGAMLQATGMSKVVEAQFSESNAAGMVALLLGFALAAVLKVAQGSSTTAMITVSAMMSSMELTQEKLGFNLVYLATAIGGGSLIGSWMNDSGFWIFARMGGLTEAEALKTWTIVLCVLGFVSLILSIVFSIVLPLKG